MSEAATIFHASGFVREAIDKRLAELRDNCALIKEGLRHATDPRSYWGTDSAGRTYWADLKAKCAVERTEELRLALDELARFVAEHRSVMGLDWIGNAHGRLCWANYLGGLPINSHYCQREEGHEGNHADEWPETRWACNHPRGSWPQGVSGDREWRELIERRKADAPEQAGDSEKAEGASL